jgi:hypothetical protein
MPDEELDRARYPQDVLFINDAVLLKKARAEAGVQIEATIPTCLNMTDTVERGLLQLRLALEGTDANAITTAKEHLRASVIEWAVGTGLDTNENIATMAVLRLSGIFTDLELGSMDVEIQAKLAAKKL